MHPKLVAQLLSSGSNHFSRVYIGYGGPLKFAHKPQPSCSHWSRKRCDCPQALLLRCSSLLCRQLHLLFKFTFLRINFSSSTWTFPPVCDGTTLPLIGVQCTVYHSDTHRHVFLCFICLALRRKALEIQFESNLLLMARTQIRTDADKIAPRHKGWRAAHQV